MTDAPPSPANCGRSAATAMAFFRSDVWRHCVLGFEHDGDCVLGLSEMQEERLASIGNEIQRYELSIRRLLEERRELELLQDKAVAARGK